MNNRDDLEISGIFGAWATNDRGNVIYTAKRKLKEVKVVLSAKSKGLYQLFLINSTYMWALLGQPTQGVIPY